MSNSGASARTKHLDVRTVAIAVGNEEIGKHHALHEIEPAVALAEFELRLAALVHEVEERIERHLAFAHLAEALRAREPRDVINPVDGNEGMHERIAHMRHSEQLHKTRCDDLVDALVPIYAPVAVITRKLVVRGICADACPRFEERTAACRGLARLGPNEMAVVLNLPYDVIRAHGRSIAYVLFYILEHNRRDPRHRPHRNPSGTPTRALRPLADRRKKAKRSQVELCHDVNEASIGLNVPCPRESGSPGTCELAKQVVLGILDER